VFTTKRVASKTVTVWANNNQRRFMDKVQARGLPGKKAGKEVSNGSNCRRAMDKLLRTDGIPPDGQMGLREPI
jgi:hypothetical protein